MNGTGLVLEGGGMRGVYTAGVLEFFMEKNLFFPYVIGVSAGACQAASYLSRQYGRNKKVNIGFIRNPDYLSWRNFFKKKELFGMDFIFDEIPKVHVPFDHQTFLNGKEQFVVGATNCSTGEAVYYQKSDVREDILTILRASSSLPMIAPIISYKGKELLDGGIADSIPIRKSMIDGNEKNVVILTRNHGYQKKKSKFMWMTNRVLRQYPKLVKQMENRYMVYNETISLLEKLEKENKVFIIRPSIKMVVRRMERNEKRLVDLYNQGYKDAESNHTKLCDWLKN